MWNNRQEFLISMPFVKNTFFKILLNADPIFDIYKTENILKGYLWGNKVLPL